MGPSLFLLYRLDIKELFRLLICSCGIVAESVGDCFSPPMFAIVNATANRVCHGEQPPTFFMAQVLPVPNRSGYRSVIVSIDSPDKQYQLLATQTLNGNATAGFPGASRYSIALQTLVEHLCDVGRQQVPLAAIDLGLEVPGTQFHAGYFLRVPMKAFIDADFPVFLLWDDDEEMVPFGTSVEPEPDEMLLHHCLMSLSKLSSEWPVSFSQARNASPVGNCTPIYSILTLGVRLLSAKKLLINMSNCACTWSAATSRPSCSSSTAHRSASTVIVTLHPRRTPLCLASCSRNRYDSGVSQVPPFFEIFVGRTGSMRSFSAIGILTWSSGISPRQRMATIILQSTGMRNAYTSAALCPAFGNE